MAEAEDYAARMSAIEATRVREAAEMAKAIEILASLNLRIRVDGCGCCRSPAFKMEYRGEMIIDQGDANFDMFEG